MGADFFLTPEATQDIDEAYAWYETQRVGLGEEFLGCVDVCIERIRKEPQWCPKVYGDYRRALLRRFPYAAFYVLDSERVVVVAVLHTARNPNKWRQRMTE